MRHYRYLRAVLGLSRFCHQPRLLQALPTLCCFHHQSHRTFTLSPASWSASNGYADVDPDGDDGIAQESFTSNILEYKRQTAMGRQTNVVVVMPRPKIGPLKKTQEKGKFLLEETITLVESISTWKVVGSHMISSPRINSKGIFGKNNLLWLKEYVHAANADTVVFARDMLTPLQHYYMQDYLGVDVYDRFSVVLKIFRDRATSKETKLQLAMAEINYVKKNLRQMSESDLSEYSFVGSLGGGVESFYKEKLQLIKEKELKLKRMLEKLDKNYEIRRQSRLKFQIPTVAVVGYTNAGKTALIKAFTHDNSLLPENRLFATLDVSLHMAKLPSNLKVMLIDTIGFITEIPTALIHSFRSTLREICTADLIVHITDSSHPDWQLQVDTVTDTLRQIEVPEKLIESMIEVSNKIDKIDEEQQKQLMQQNRMLISTTERIGLDELKAAIQKALIDNTDRFMFDIRVPSGGDQYQWLYREASIVECQSDEKDANYMVMKVIVTKAKLGKFIKHFSKTTV